MKKQMWTVTLVKATAANVYRDGYFPRRFYYKADALRLRAEVQRNGGEATVAREDACAHDWQEQPGEPPVDVCNSCGERRY